MEGKAYILLTTPCFSANALAFCSLVWGYNSRIKSAYSIHLLLKDLYGRETHTATAGAAVWSTGTESVAGADMMIVWRG